MDEVSLKDVLLKEGKLLQRSASVDNRSRCEFLASSLALLREIALCGLVLQIIMPELDRSAPHLTASVSIDPEELTARESCPARAG